MQTKAKSKKRKKQLVSDEPWEPVNAPDINRDEQPSDSAMVCSTFCTVLYCALGPQAGQSETANTANTLCLQGTQRDPPGEFQTPTRELQGATGHRLDKEGASAGETGSQSVDTIAFAAAKQRGVQAMGSLSQLAAAPDLEMCWGAINSLTEAVSAMLRAETAGERRQSCLSLGISPLLMQDRYPSWCSVPISSG